MTDCSIRSYSALLCLGLALAAGAQTVTTVVPGPGPFNDGLALDAQGNIYAAWYYGTVITRITPDGQMSTFADSLASPNGIVFDGAGNLWVPNAGGDTVIRFDPDGNGTVVIPEIDTPSGLLLMPDGSLLISQYDQARISRWTEEGGLETWLQGGFISSPVGMQLDGEGNVYIANFTNGTVIRRTPEGQLAQIADIPGWLGFIALAGDYLYLTAYQQQRIYRTALDGSGTQVWAGSGLQGQVDGPVNEAWFHQPNGIVASPTGDTLYVSDYGTRSLRRITGVASQTWIPLEEAPLPGELELLPNYPNPFNPGTRIPFRLDHAGPVRLVVHDLAGRRVAVLAEGPLPAGQHEVAFDGAGLAGGVYLATLEQHGLRQTRKLLLLP